MAMTCEHEWEDWTRYFIGTEEGSAESIDRYGVHVERGTGRIQECVKCHMRRDDPDPSSSRRREYVDVAGRL